MISDSDIKNFKPHDPTDEDIAEAKKLENGFWLTVCYQSCEKCMYRGKKGVNCQSLYFAQLLKQNEMIIQGRLLHEAQSSKRLDDERREIDKEN